MCQPSSLPASAPQWLGLGRRPDTQAALDSGWCHSVLSRATTDVRTWGRLRPARHHHQRTGTSTGACGMPCHSACAPCQTLPNSYLGVSRLVVVGDVAIIKGQRALESSSEENPRKRKRAHLASPARFGACSSTHGKKGRAARRCTYIYTWPHIRGCAVNSPKSATRHAMPVMGVRQCTGPVAASSSSSAACRAYQALAGDRMMMMMRAASLATVACR